MTECVYLKRYLVRVPGCNEGQDWADDTIRNVEGGAILIFCCRWGVVKFNLEHQKKFLCVKKLEGLKNLLRDNKGFLGQLFLLGVQHFLWGRFICSGGI